MKAKLVHFKIYNKYQNPFLLYKFCPFRYFAVVPVFLVVLINIGTVFTEPQVVNGHMRLVQGALNSCTPRESQAKFRDGTLRGL